MNPKSLLLFLIVMAAGLMVDEVYRPHGSAQTSIKVEIPQGFGSRNIAGLLKNEGIIRSKWTFVAYTSLRGRASYLKPGLYEFNHVSIADVAERLIEGGENEFVITIPEGWTGDAIARHLEKQNIVASENFLAFIAQNAYPNFEERFLFLADRPVDAGLEGYLFPDTYRIHQGTPPDKVAAKMLDNFDKKISQELRDEAARQGKSLFEIITMSSLIEKEVRSDEDRALVSGILWKRLNTGIPLQVDATITYITGKKTTKISAEETKIGSPYNTYTHKGLPAGPIANPGLSAIRAALYPEASPYLYYLSAPDGATIYSRTLEEHNGAKARYLTN